MTSNEKVYLAVADYYGSLLTGTGDLKTSACCTTDSLPVYLRPIHASLHPEITERFYGCGSPIPDLVEGKTILDLGCGTGRDCFLLAPLVGANGLVIGLDMTPEQIGIARNHQEYQAAQAGLQEPNTKFIDGYIENLQQAGIADNSVDIVISNCVINISPDKESVFREIFRVLKVGGELLFADIFADRRLDPELGNDPVIRGECLGGAMYRGDFQTLLRRIGIAEFRVVKSHPVTVTNEAIANRLGHVTFTSETIRAFKLTLEDRCEDYGELLTYRGSIPYQPNCFALDDHHFFETNRPERVCSNTADMIIQTRYADHFVYQGSRAQHFGLFPCEAVHRPQTAMSGRSSCC